MTSLSSACAVASLAGALRKAPPVLRYRLRVNRRRTLSKRKKSGEERVRGRTGTNPPSRRAAGLWSARYSRIKGTNRTGTMIVVVAVPSACLTNTMSC